MQRRYALLAAALVVLVLVPAAVMAAGFGPKGSPLGMKNWTRGLPDCTGNRTVLGANASAGPGDGVCPGDHARNCTQLRDGDGIANRSGARTCTWPGNQTARPDRGVGQDHALAPNGTCTNQTTGPENGHRLAVQGRAGNGRGR